MHPLPVRRLYIGHGSYGSHAWPSSMSSLIDMVQVVADADTQCGLCHHQYFEHESSLDEILSQVSAIFRKAGIAGRCGGMVYVCVSFAYRQK